MDSETNEKSTIMVITILPYHIFHILRVINADILARSESLT